jgi:hypothetical protein
MKAASDRKPFLLLLGLLGAALVVLVIHAPGAATVLIVDFSGWGQVLGVAATFAVAQAIEGYS